MAIPPKQLQAFAKGPKPGDTGLPKGFKPKGPPQAKQKTPDDEESADADGGSGDREGGAQPNKGFDVNKAMHALRPCIEDIEHAAMGVDGPLDLDGEPDVAMIAAVRGAVDSLDDDVADTLRDAVKGIDIEGAQKLADELGEGDPDKMAAFFYFVSKAHERDAEENEGDDAGDGEEDTEE